MITPSAPSRPTTTLVTNAPAHRVDAAGVQPILVIRLTATSAEAAPATRLAETTVGSEMAAEAMATASVTEVEISRWSTHSVVPNQASASSASSPAPGPGTRPVARVVGRDEIRTGLSSTSGSSSAGWSRVASSTGDSASVDASASAAATSTAGSASGSPSGARCAITIGAGSPVVGESGSVPTAPVRSLIVSPSVGSTPVRSTHQGTRAR
jgi:hypothetical protein